MKLYILVVSICLFCIFNVQAGIMTLTAENISVSIKNASKPIVIYFFTDECPPCAEMKPVFEQVTQELEPMYHFAWANDDKLAELYKVTAYPTVVVIAAQQVLGKIEGKTELPVLRNQLQEIGQANSALTLQLLKVRFARILQFNSAQELDEFLKSNPIIRADEKIDDTIDYPLLFVIANCPYLKEAHDKVKVLLKHGAHLTIQDINHKVDLCEQASKLMWEAERALKSYHELLSILKAHEDTTK